MVAATLALGGCDDGTREETQLQPEPLPPQKAAPQKAQPALAFALVAEKTALHAGPNDSTASFRPKDRLPSGSARGGAVLFAIDGEQPATKAWVRLVATERQGRCGYAPMDLDAPVYVKRADLMRTLTAPATIDGPGKTRIELQPGVALRPSGKLPATYTVTTREVRLQLDLKDHPVTSNLGEEALEEDPPAAASASGPPPPAKTPGRFGLRPSEALLVGPHRVRLSTKHPPTLTPVEGHDALAMLDTPCVDVVGVEVKPPDPMIARREAIEKESKAILELLASDAGSFGSLDDALMAGGSDLDQALAGGTAVPGGSFGPPEPRRGGGGRVDLGGLGRTGEAADLRPRRKARPTLTLGTTHTTKGLDDAVVRRIVRGRQSRLLACYERALSRDATLRGHVLLAFTIQLDGQVGSARSEPKSEHLPQGTDLPDPSVVSCMVRALGGITFPKPTGDRPVKAKIRLTLRP